MSDFSLTLGPVAFAGFELPSSITFGGRQRLAIHRLPGGVRIIDALGPDPADIAFSGIFSGPDAADRARLLDTIRVNGLALPLAWDAFLYTVILARFEANYQSPWWIPYKISCTVVRDEAAAAVSTILDLGSTVSADLLSAGVLGSSAMSAVAAAGAIVIGTPAYAAAQTAIASTLSGIATQIAATEPSLQTSSVSAAVTASGLLAQLSVARPYVQRAGRNLADATT